MLRYLLILLCSFPLLLTAQEKKQIALEDIFSKNVFKQESVSGFRSMKDGRHYAETSEGVLREMKFSDGKVERELVDLKSLQYLGKSISVSDYVFNDDETKLLLFTESENIYRRSVLHKVYIYDFASEKITLLRDEKVLHASFSPQSDKVAYVYQNNVYFLDINSNETIQCTKDGSYNIINGNCDWVYEEEFEFTKAYTWSADGSYIAYYRFDQSAVPEYNFALYDHLYPSDYKYRYPKAGENNSEVDVYIYHLESERSVRCKLSEELNYYIPRIRINEFNNTLIVYSLNRLQNQLSLLEVNSKTGNTSVIYEEQNSSYIEVNDNIVFLKNRNAFVYTSEKDGYNHIYLHDIDRNHSTQLTKGNWDVVSLKGVDEKRGQVYYISAVLSPLERSLHAVTLDGTKNVNMTETSRGWHDITFSSNYDFYLDKYSKINTPPTFTLFENMGSIAVVRVLKENESLKKKLTEYDIAPIELIQVPNEQGVLLNGYIIKPSNFSENKKYPLLMCQYSGPGSQQVKNQFAPQYYWWHQMLAQKGYIVVCVDGTGTGFRGEEFKKKTYLQLGKYESDDQIAVAKYFAKQSYIDASRIGIWGWSYGGFMSSTCILKGADVFKAAIAVAPVTNWRYYDNIYTERYMRTPQENALGYDDNSPVNMVNKLKGNFLLVHGTADDNVHYQNSMMMTDAMIKANKDFDSEYYPNKNHGISGGVTSLHLYRKMTQFILEKL